MADPVQSHEPKARGADLVIPLLALAFALYFFSSIRGLVWEAKANGVVIGSVLLFLVAIQIVRTGLEVWQGRATLGFDALTQPRGVQLQRLALVLVLAAFVGTIHVLGTILGLTLAMGALMAILGVRDWRWLLGLPLAVSVSLHLLFVVLLGARLPAGPVENLLGAVIGG